MDACVADASGSEKKLHDASHDIEPEQGWIYPDKCPSMDRSGARLVAESIQPRHGEALLQVWCWHLWIEADSLREGQQERQGQRQGNIAASHPFRKCSGKDGAPAHLFRTGQKER